MKVKRSIVVYSIFAVFLMLSIPLVSSLNATNSGVSFEYKVIDEKCGLCSKYSEPETFEEDFESFLNSFFSDTDDCNSCDSSRNPLRCRILFFFYLLNYIPIALLALVVQGNNIYPGSPLIIPALIIYLVNCLFFRTIIRAVGLMCLCNIFEWDERIGEIFNFLPDTNSFFGNASHSSLNKSLCV
jgi:hypothetical protein